MLCVLGAQEMVCAESSGRRMSHERAEERGGVVEKGRRPPCVVRISRATSRYPLIASNSSYLAAYQISVLALALRGRVVGATSEAPKSTCGGRTTLQWEEAVPRARSRCPPIPLTPHSASSTSSKDHHDHLVRSEESSSASQVRLLPPMNVMRASPTVLSVSFRRL